MVVLTDLLPPTFAFLSAGFCVYVGLRLHRRAQTIERTPTTPCAYVAPGRMELVGRAQPTGGRPVTARLSGQPAAMVRYELQMKGKDQWSTLHGWSEPGGFVLDDGTGRVIVAPAAEDVDLGHERSPTSKLRDDMDPGLQQKVREHLKGKFPTGFWGSNYRIAEKAVPVGAAVYALGEAKAHMLHDEPKVRFMLTSGPEQTLLVSLAGESQQLKRIRHKAYGIWAMGAFMLVIGLFLLTTLF
jgi:hypothetical protein